MPLILQLDQTIAASPAVVWAALTDIANWSRWMPNLVRLEVMDDEAIAAGKKFRETRTLFGREATEVFEVMHMQAPEELELHVDGRQGSSRRGSYWFRYRLEPVAVGTCLHLHGRIEGMGWFFRNVGRLFVGVFRHALAKDLAAFKRYVEAQPAR
jgi:hypothetical protein